MDLSLRFEDNETGHNDIVLRFGGHRASADAMCKLGKIGGCAIAPFP